MIEKLLKIKEDKQDKYLEYQKKLLKELYNLIDKKLDKGVDYLTSSEFNKYKLLDIITGFEFKCEYTFCSLRYYFTELGLKKIESKMIEYGLLDLDDN